MTPNRDRERGQATVELVLVLPVLLIAVLLVLQVAVVVRAHALVVDGAREGARVAAMGGRSDAVARAVRATPGLDPARLQVSTTRSGPDDGTVAVTVRYRLATDVALIGGLVGDRELTATVRMQVEESAAPT